MDSGKKEVAHIISNTHWDREWYQSHEKYLVRLVGLCDRLTELLERNKEYRFVLDGQYALIGDYLAVRPEMKDRVAELVKEKRLLPGPWYTQPLENIAGGEALIRNLQYGIALSDDLGGAMRFSYEVDEFGHTSQLPQILKGFDIDGVIAWRGVPADSKNIFTWAAPDGTAVDMFRTNEGYGEATDLPVEEEDRNYFIDGREFERDGLISRVNAIREMRLKMAVSKHELWLNGIDHSWAQEDLFEVMEKIRALFPDLEVRQSVPQEYADAVRQDIRERGITPERVTGELMINKEGVLESTNALHPREKKRHYESEDLLTRKLEPLACAASLYGRPYPEWAVDRAWLYVLENHAHDSLGCCSVDEVFEQVMARYGAAMSLAEQVADGSLRYLMSLYDDAPSVFVFNMTARPAGGTGLYTLDVPSHMGGIGMILKTPDGTPVPMKILSSAPVGDVRYNPRRGHPTYDTKTRMQVLLDLPMIPAAGFMRLTIEDNGEKKAYTPEEILRTGEATSGNGPVPSGLPVLENAFLRLSFNENGTFDMLDKATGRIYPSQLLLEDTGDAGTVYDHELPADDREVILSENAKAEIRVLYEEPMASSVASTVTLALPRAGSIDRTSRTAETDTVRVTFTVTLYHDARRVDIRAEVANRCEDHRLRVLFPTAFADAGQSFSGQAFDTVYRPVEPDASASWKVYRTHPMQDLCGTFENGAALLLGARGIYEYECTGDACRALALTLLRANDIIDTGYFAVTPEYIMHEAQNLCTLSFDLTLVPADSPEQGVAELSRGLFKPELAVNRAPEEAVLRGYERPWKNRPALPAEGAAFRLTGEGLVVTTFKRARARDSVIVRILNESGTAQSGSFEMTLPGIGFSCVYRTDLEEKKREKAAEGPRVTFTLEPHRLLTLEFTRFFAQ